MAPAVSVSPELPRAEAPPRPPSLEPARNDKIDAPIVARSEPASTPPAPIVTSAPSEPAPVAPPSAPADWWLHEPAQEPGRVRMVVSATADSLRDARRAAVDEGLRRLQGAVGGPPTNLRYELTTVQRDAPGVYRGYVLISCDAP